MSIKRFFKDIPYQGHKLILLFIVIFTLICWVLLTLTEKLGPPDVYKLYEAAGKIYSGNLKIGIIPPLFPIVQYPISKIIALFTNPIDAFILAGRIISLFAGLGTLLFSYLILKRFIEKYAVLPVIFLVISPWYLKLLAFPITDMLYLFFVSASFYSFLPRKNSHWGWTVLAVAGGVLTRFEGVLLIISGFLRYFKLKKKTLIIFAASLPVMALFMYLFLTFFNRFWAHFRDIILPQKTYLFIFQHPMDFLNVIYGNILYFIPFSFPYFLKLFLLLMILALFAYGIYRLFKAERRFTVVLLVYELLFLIAKGYVDTTRPDIEFRRIFSGLWIFYLVCFMGGYFLLRELKTKPRIRQAIFIIAGLLMVLFALYIKPVAILPGLAALLPAAALVWLIKDRRIHRFLRYGVMLLLAVFVFQLFQPGLIKSREYVASMAPKAPYAAAQWINRARLKPNAVVLSYTNNLMMGFYLDANKLGQTNITWETFTIPLEVTDETKARYMAAFFKEIDERKVDYIIADSYVVPKDEFFDLNQAKRMLFEERENKKYFRVKKYLFYKGENVGYILRPVDVKTEPAQAAHAETDH